MSVVREASRPPSVESRRRSVWVCAALWIGAVWIVAMLAMTLIRSTQPSPRKVTSYLEQNGLNGQSEDERARIIAGLASQLNRLGYEELRQVRQSPGMRAAYRLMTSEEKERFLTATSHSGGRLMLAAARKVPPAKREAFLHRAWYEWEIEITSDASAPFNRKRMEAVFADAFTEAYRELPPVLQAELKPVLRRTIPLPLKGL